MGLHGDRSTLTEEQYRANRARNASKARAPKHRRSDGPRYNRDVDDVMRPEPAPEGADLVPLGS